MKNFALKFALTVPILASLLFTVPAQASQFTDVPDDYWAKDSIEFMVSKGVLKGYEDGTFKPEAPVDKSELTVIVYKLFDRLRLSEESGAIKNYSDVPQNHWAHQYITQMYDQYADGSAYYAAYPPGLQYDMAIIETGMPPVPDAIYFKPDKKVTRWDAALMFGYFFGKSANSQASTEAALNKLTMIKDLPVKPLGFVPDVERLQALLDERRPKGDTTIYYWEGGGHKYVIDSAPPFDTFRAENVASIINQGLMTPWQGKFESTDLLTRAQSVTILTRFYQQSQKNGTLQQYSSK